MSAALTNHRVLTPTEARVLTAGGMLLFALGVLAVGYPRTISLPFAVFAFWVALTVWVRAVRLVSRRREAGGHSRLDRER